MALSSNLEETTEFLYTLDPNMKAFLFCGTLINACCLINILMTVHDTLRELIILKRERKIGGKVVQRIGCLGGREWWMRAWSCRVLRLGKAVGCGCGISDRDESGAGTDGLKCHITVLVIFQNQLPRAEKRKNKVFPKPLTGLWQAQPINQERATHLN